MGESLDFRTLTFFMPQNSRKESMTQLVLSFYERLETKRDQALPPHLMTSSPDKAPTLCSVCTMPMTSAGVAPAFCRDSTTVLRVAP